MNKLFTKIAALVLGMTMAVGVGVAVGSGVKASEADAAYNDGTAVTLPSGYKASTTQVKDSTGVIGFTNSASNSYSNPCRIYANNTFTIEIVDSTKATSINGVVIGASSDSYATVAGDAKWTVVSGGGSISNTVSGSNVTATTTGTATKITIKPSAQTRWSTLTVYYAGSTTTEATGMTITPTTSTTIYAGESVSFTTALTGGSGAYEKTIGWTSNNSSVISAPANSEEGDTVSVTATNSVATQTIVRLTGTVVSPGSATNYIDITVKPARTMQSISLHGTIEKDEYYVGDSWDLTGLDIQVNWSEGDPTYVKFDDEEVDYECKPAIADVTTRTSFDIDVMYGDFFETFTVEGIIVSDKPIQDVLRIDSTSLNVPTGSGYQSFSNRNSGNASDITSTATYAGKAIVNSSTNLQLNGNNGAVYTTASSKQYIKSASIELSQSTTRTLTIYGSHTAYSSILSSDWGTALLEFTDDGSATVDVEKLGYFEYIYIRASGAMYFKNITVVWGSLDPVIEYSDGTTTADLTVIMGTQNTVTINAKNFESLSASIFSNTPNNDDSSYANLSYTVEDTVVTVTVTGKDIGNESFAISATGCSNTLTLNVTVQASTTFDSLVITNPTTATTFNEEDAFAVTGLVVTANFTVGGEQETQTFAASDADHPLTALTFTVGGNVIEIGDTLTTAGQLSVVISYTDTATSTTRSAEAYNITVNGYVAHTWTKVTEAPADWRGTYLIVYENTSDASSSSALNGSATSMAAGNYVVVNTSTSTITGSKTIDAAAFHILRDDDSNYRIKNLSGDYLTGSTGSSNTNLSFTTSAEAANLAVIESPNLIKLGNGYIRYNTNWSGSQGFRYYASSTSVSAAVLYKMDVTDTINTEVSTFVGGFHSSIGGVCDEGGADTDVSTLNATWTSQASAFDGLSVDAQGILANTTYTHNAETPGSTKDIVDRYDYVFSKYSEQLTKGDFMDRTKAGTLVSYSIINVNPISIFGTTENSNAIAIVVIVSVVSLTAIGGYFFLRKKREQN